METSHTLGAIDRNILKVAQVKRLEHMLSRGEFKGSGLVVSVSYPHQDPDFIESASPEDNEALLVALIKGLKADLQVNKAIIRGDLGKIQQDIMKVRAYIDEIDT